MGFEGVINDNTGAATRSFSDANIMALMASDFGADIAVKPAPAGPAAAPALSMASGPSFTPGGGLF